MHDPKAEAMRVLAGKLSAGDLRALERGNLLSPTVASTVMHLKKSSGKGYSLGSVSAFHPCEMTDYEAHLLYFGIGLATRFALRSTTLHYFAFASSAKAAMSERDVSTNISVGSKFRTAAKKLFKESGDQAYSRSIPRFLAAEFGISITEGSKALARAIHSLPTYVTTVQSAMRHNPLRTSAETYAFWMALAAAIQPLKFGQAWKAKKKAVTKVINTWGLNALAVDPSRARGFIKALERGSPDEINVAADIAALQDTGAYQDDQEQHEEGSAAQEMGDNGADEIEEGHAAMDEIEEEAGGLWDLVKSGASALFSGASRAVQGVAPIVTSMMQPGPGGSESPASQIMTQTAQRMSAPSEDSDDGGGDEEGAACPPRGAKKSPFFLETKPRVIKRAARPAPIKR
jgi:hypothetical protein